MKVLGLDLGTNSVGWALVVHNDSRRPSITAGSFVFPEPGEEEKGLFVSHRRKRGEKRRQRRNLRRKRQRRNQLVRILVANGMLPATAEERFEFLTKSDPYALRKRGLDEALTPMEFGRVLYHICRRRGYLSTALLRLRGIEGVKEVEARLTLDDQAEDVEEISEEKKDERGMLGQIAKLRALLKEGAARTIGEFYADRIRERIPVRLASKNKKHIDNLGMRADRAMFEEEFDILWSVQAKHNPSLTSALKAEIYNAIFHQRPLKPSTHAVGNCEFFPKRRRAARASFVFQRSQILQYLNTLSVFHPDHGTNKLTPEQISCLANELDRVDELSWDGARKVLGLSSEWTFSDEPGSTKRGRKVRGRQSIKGNRTSAAMRKALGAKWDSFSSAQQENIIHRLLTCRNLKDIAPGLKRDFGLSNEELYNVVTAEIPEGYGNHSTKVLRMIEPYLLQGFVYSEALERAGLREPNTSTERAVVEAADYAKAPTNINNPIVSRAVQKAIKVANSIIEKYGKPDVIRVELARDVARTNKQREKVWKIQDENNKERERAAKELSQQGLPVNEKNIEKVRLWWEANCTSPYEPDKSVTLRQLIEDYDIDHIVPRSRCWDNSLFNRTICPMSVNLHKGDRTPYEAFGHDEERWKRIEVHVNNLKKMDSKKRQRILRKQWEDTDFTNNALSNTSYISREVMKALKLLGVPVQVTTGRLNAELRRLWELGSVLPLSEADIEEIRKQRKKAMLKKRSDHRHHALDAILTALTDTKTLQILTRYYKERESGKSNKTVDKPKPWPEIVEDLKRVIEAAPIVFEQTRGLMGPLHEETARTPPSREAVDAALAAMPESHRRRIKNCVVVDKQLVWLNEKGEPYKAYDLGSNHHCVVWEPLAPNKKGEFVRELEVVPMAVAAMRATCGEPVVKRHREGYRYVMSLCKNDHVEFESQKGPVLMRVAKLFASGSGPFELCLAPLTEARERRIAEVDEGGTKKMRREYSKPSDADGTKRVYIKGKKDLARVLRRVILSPIGDEIGSEPPDAGD